MYNSFIEKSFYENLLKSSELSSSSCETQQQCRYVSILYSKYHKNIIKVLAVHVKHVPSLLLCSLIVQNYRLLYNIINIVIIIKQDLQSIHH